MSVEQLQAILAKLKPQHPQECGLRAGETVRLIEELLSYKLNESAQHRKLQ